MGALALLLIVFNLGLILLATRSFFSVLDSPTDAVMYLFILGVSVANIRHAYKCGSSMFQKKVGGRWWLFFFNLITIILSLNILIYGDLSSKFFGVCLFTTAVGTALFLFNLYHDDLENDLHRDDLSEKTTQPESVFSSVDSFKHNMNLVFAGAQRPSRERKLASFSICIALVLTYYAASPMLYGAYGDLFVPSDLWLFIGWAISWILAFLTGSTFIKTAHEAGQAGVAPNKQLPRSVFSACVLVIIFAFAVINSTGKILNNLIGTESVKTFVVVKDPDIERSYGTRSSYRRHKIVYCVNSQSFENAILIDEYCLIRPEHYYQLPDNESVEMRFLTHDSFLGETIKGYYFKDE